MRVTPFVVIGTIVGLTAGLAIAAVSLCDWWRDLKIIVPFPPGRHKTSMRAHVAAMSDRIRLTVVRNRSAPRGTLIHFVEVMKAGRLQTPAGAPIPRRPAARATSSST